MSKSTALPTQPRHCFEASGNFHHCPISASPKPYHYTSKTACLNLFRHLRRQLLEVQISPIHYSFHAVAFDLVSSDDPSSATEEMDTNDDQPAAPTPPAPAPAATPEAPDKETMEAIRRRRLQKLGGPSSSSSSPAPGAGQSSPKPESNEKLVAATASNPFVADKPTEAEKENRQKITITPLPKQSPAGSSNQHRDKRKASEIDPAPATPPSRKPTPKEESIQDYADRTLSAIFRITLDPIRKTDAHGHKLTFLQDLSSDLASDGLPLKLSVDRLEEAIMEAARAVPNNKPLFEYLLPCWKRTTRVIKAFRGGAPQKEAILKEARRLCFSNCIFALTIPDLFE